MIKKIAIIFADINEKPDSINLFTQDTKERVFLTWTLIAKNVKIILIHSKIGITNAAACTQYLINKYQPDVIYNYGAVGATSPLKKYSIVIPKFIFYDLFVPGYKYGQIPGESPKFVNHHQQPSQNNLLTSLSFVSWNKFKQIKLKNHFQIFDMEGAAIAQIGEANNVPVIIIKAVSDLINKNSNFKNINIEIKKAGNIAFNKLRETIDLF